MRGFGYSIVEPGEQGSGTGNQGYVDVAMPPPPPPQVSTGQDWANPYTSSPPLVAVSATQPTTDWMGMGQKFTTGLVDIFGRIVNPQGQVIPQQRPLPQQGIPLLGWVAIGVAGVVVLGVAARSLRSRSVAGYRRKHRR